MRELCFWAREAEIHGLEEQLRMTEAARSGQVEQKSYKQIVGGVAQRINDLRHGITAQERATRNWDRLFKRFGR